LPPSRIWVGIGKSHVESLLEDSAGAAELEWASGSQVVGIDLSSGPPYLHVGDQLGGHGSV
jgi:hypothetical protein